MSSPRHYSRDATRLKSLRRVLTLMAAGVAVAVFVTIPAIFFSTAYYYETIRTERFAEDIANQVSQFAYRDPDLWQFNAHRLEQILREVSRSEHTRQLFNSDGEIISEWRPDTNYGSPQDSFGPDLDGRADIHNGPIVVGQVRVFGSLWPIWTATGWITLLGSALALAVFIILRTLPLRALDKALDRLARAHGKLRGRVVELEATKNTLENQKVELMRSATDLTAARDEAEVANRTKAEFIANMSHELRTPLNAIIGFSDLLTDQPLEEAAADTATRDYAGHINEAGQHLLSLINDILDMSKIEAGRIDLSDEIFDMNSAIDSSITMIKDRAVDGGIELSVDVTASTLPLLRADKTRIKQVILNLLSNAVKFTKAGGSITLKAWHHEESGFVMQVIDTGIGIAPDDIPRALARFQQVEATLDRQHEGTGLGLPLTKALVEQHGGTLDLQSQIGRGTTVTVRLPASRVVEVGLGTPRQDEKLSAVG